MDETLEKFKNMTPEEANAYLEDFEECTHDCSTCGSDCADKVAKPAKKVIAVLSGKGGTGKSAMTVLMALALKKQGLRVGILDADVVGASIPHMLGLNDPVVGDSVSMDAVMSDCGIPVLSMALISASKEEPIIWAGLDLAKVAVYFFREGKWPELDVLLVDMPSGAGDIPLEYFTTMPFDNSILVSTPGALSQLICIRAGNLAEMLMVPTMGVVENFADAETGPDRMGLYPIALRIPYDRAIREAADAGKLGHFETDKLDFFARMIGETL